MNRISSLYRQKNTIRNLLLSGALLLLYVLTYFLSPFVEHPIDALDFIATAGTITGIGLVLCWMPMPYFYTLAFFCCFAQYFGMMFDGYIIISWYDLALHFTSGIMLGAFGYYLFRLLNKKVSGQLPISIAVLFSVFFAISCAGLWEIYEFLADTFGGLSAQGVGVQDTMEDIIAGTIGAVLYGTGLTFYLKTTTKKAGE